MYKRKLLISGIPSPNLFPRTIFLTSCIKMYLFVVSNSWWIKYGLNIFAKCTGGYNKNIWSCFYPPRAYSAVIKSTGFKLYRLICKFWLLGLLSTWTWKNYLLTLSINYLVGKCNTFLLCSYECNSCNEYKVIFIKH